MQTGQRSVQQPLALQDWPLLSGKMESNSGVWSAPEMPRRHAGFFLEFFYEIEVVVKAHCLADGCQGQIGGEEELFCPFHPEAGDILGIGHAGLVFDQGAHIGGA